MQQNSSDFEVGQEMSRIAIDVVLLPDAGMTERAIQANRELVRQYGEKIVLDKQKCLPHISLAMGCLDQGDLTAAAGLLKDIAEQNPLPELQVIGVRTSTNSAGEKASILEVEKTEELLRLHEEVMETFAPYLSRDVTRDMLYDPAEAAESTLLWIKNYREKSSFENFLPHITIGYGEAENGPFPIRFSASELALCHLGNHCTCRKVLAAAQIATLR